MQIPDFTKSEKEYKTVPAKKGIVQTMKEGVDVAKKLINKKERNKEIMT